MTLVEINGFVLFPHFFMWRRNPVGKRIWETEIAEAVDGAETRNSLRAVSRRSVTFEIFVRTAERTRLEARVDAAKASGRACAPLLGRGSYLTAAAAVAANQINVTTDGWNWQVGDYVILIGNDQTFDVAAVNDVTGDVLTLATNLNFQWPNKFVVRPLIFGAFTADKETAITGQAAGWKITITELTSARAAQLGVTSAQGIPGVGEQKIGRTNQIA